MPERPAQLAFSTWRDLWASLDGVPRLLTEADAVLQRRAAGNQRIPRYDPTDDGETLVLGIRALRGWAQGEPPADAAMRPDIIRRIHSIVQPALRAAAWPRWLLLERAFCDGSATGDLLFAALTLRTMCEEVQRLHALDLDADRLASLAASNVTADQERLKLFLSVAWTALDGLPRETVLDGENWPSLKLIGTALPRLETARRSLRARPKRG